MSHTNLRALVGGRVVFNTRANFVSFAILGQRRLCACTFQRVLLFDGYVTSLRKMLRNGKGLRIYRRVAVVDATLRSVLLRGSDRLRSHEDFAADLTLPFCQACGTPALPKFYGAFQCELAVFGGLLSQKLAEQSACGHVRGMPECVDHRAGLIGGADAVSVRASGRTETLVDSSRRVRCIVCSAAAASAGSWSCVGKRVRSRIHIVVCSCCRCVWDRGRLCIAFL